jgi:hypothetical protein
VIASVFGVIFASSRQEAAAQLARVCGPGGCVALTAWPRDDFSELGAKLGRELPPGDSAWDWAREDYTRSLLGAVWIFGSSRDGG